MSNKYIASIMCDDLDSCYICHSMREDMHHIFEGTANRRLSDKYLLKIPICRRCHDYITNHPNSDLDRRLKREAQECFEQVFLSEDFRQIFGRNWK